MTMRSLDELLALDTYQGMTDDEINAIVDFKAQEIADGMVISAEQEHMHEFAESMRQTAAANAQRTQEIYDIMVMDSRALAHPTVASLYVPEAVGDYEQA